MGDCLRYFIVEADISSHPRIAYNIPNASYVLIDLLPKDSRWPLKVISVRTSGGACAEMVPAPIS
jgi:hypothetical protein